jgi:hypothetical protein
MAVMATAVHAAADGGLVRKAVVLRHGQRIHVGTQADGLAAAARAQHAHDARFAQPGMHFQAPFAQAFGHQVRRTRLLEGKFGMRVDIPAQRSQLRMRAFDFGNGFHGDGDNSKEVSF